MRSAFRTTQDNRCGHAWKGENLYRNSDLFWTRCRSQKDPRCQGSLCAKHCKEFCDGKCMS